jgi:hypothetical protein
MMLVVPNAGQTAKTSFAETVESDCDLIDKMMMIIITTSIK